MARRDVFDEGVRGARGGAPSGKEQTPGGAVGSGSDLGEVIGAYGKKKGEASELEARAWGAVAAIVERTYLELLGLSPVVVEIRSGVETLQKWTVETDGRLESLESRLRRLTDQVAVLASEVAVLKRNMEQVRLLTERVADRVDKLSNEFIERQVKEPLLKDQVCIYNDMRQEAGNGGNGIAPVMERARSLLEARGAVLIEPEEGSSFDPKEHQGIEKVLTSRKKLDRRVAKVHRAGLRLNGRVVQQAWVAVYLFEEKGVPATGKQGE